MDYASHVRRWEQLILQIEDKIAEKSHFWVETSWIKYTIATHWNLTFFDKKSATLWQLID
jgi:hypothetical protein